jgi:hypothetical protein
MLVMLKFASFRDPLQPSRVHLERIDSEELLDRLLGQAANRPDRVLRGDEEADLPGLEEGRLGDYAQVRVVQHLVIDLRPAG